jgi:fucose 4-O-acetylase-like acetyltransferase
MKRILWIDQAKAIGIFLVILAHTQICSPVTDWISVFRMPLFFFLSGCLFSFERNADIVKFIKKRFHQIVIPYILINLITYFFWLLISRHYGASGEEAGASWYNPLIAALLCNGKEMVHNIPLWFLLCLFLIEVTYYFVYKPLSRWQRWAMTILFGLLGYINYKFIPFVLPFSLGTAFVGMIFYFLGHELIGKIQTIRLSPLLQLFLLVLSTSIVTYFSVANDRVYLYCNHYGNYLLFMVAALSGIMMMYSLTDFLSKWMGNKRIIEYISRNTLTICGFHLMTYTLLKGVAVYIIGLPLEVFNGTILPNVILALAGMALCCLLAYVLERYLPVVLGK